MIKKQQKWIALFVALTFIWLMQVSTMPAAAAGTTEQVSSAGAEQGPDYYEAVSQKAAVAKKSSILPYVLIGVGVLAVTAVVLFLFVLNKYDIRGTWTYKWRNSTDTNYTTQSITFAGERTSGTSTYFGTNGTYTVKGKKLTATWTYSGTTIKVDIAGEFTDKDNVAGTWTATSGVHGDWLMIRVSSATSIETHGLKIGVDR